MSARPPMLRQILRQCFWDVYDHLGRVALLQFLCVLIAVPLFSAGMAVLGTMPATSTPLLAVLQVLVLLFVGIACGGAAWSGLFLPFAGFVSAEKDPPLREAFRGLLRRGPALLALFGVVALVGVILLLNMWFYFFSGTLEGSLRLLGYLLGGVCFWLVAALAGLALHAAVAVARGASPGRATWRNAFVRTLRHPGATFGTLVLIVSLLVIGAALRLIGVILVGFFLPMFLANSLCDVIDANERVAARRMAKCPTERPASWKQIRAEEDATEEERLNRARYERGWRDLMRPWEM